MGDISELSLVMNVDERNLKCNHCSIPKVAGLIPIVVGYTFWVAQCGREKHDFYLNT